MGIFAFANVSSIILIMTFVEDWNKFRNPHSFIFLFIYMLTYIVTVKIKPSKLAFVFFIVKGYADVLVPMAKFFELNFFSYGNKESFQLTFNLIVLVLLIFTFLPMWILLRKKVSLVIETETSAWRFLWIIPAILYFMNFTFNKTDSSIIKQWQFALFDLLMMIGSYIIYYVTIEMLLKTQSNTEFQERIHQAENQLSMQINQYVQLGYYIESSRKLNHDIRHHLVTLQGMANGDSIKPIQDYLASLTNEIQVLSEIILCKNPAVNALLCHYNNICKNEGITFKCNVTLSADHAISDNLLCVVFGNSLENSIEACRRIENGNRFITIISKLEGTKLFIAIDNSFNGNVTKSGNVFLSSKQKNRAGIGLSSIRTIAEKYDGSVNFKADGCIFKTDIMLDVEFN